MYTIPQKKTVQEVPLAKTERPKFEHREYHMESKEDNPGNRISFSHDVIGGQTMIIFRDAEDKVILSCNKHLWDETEAGLQANTRDDIMRAISVFYG